MKSLCRACWLVLVTTSVAAAEDAHGAAEPSLFAGTLAQSIAAIIVFLILLAVLSKFAWGPILTGLQDRERKIQGDLERAEAAAKEATETLKQYERKLAEARAEAGKVIEQGKVDAQRVAAGIKQQVEAEINQLRRRAESDITAAKQQAVSDLYAQAAELSTAVAGRILQREINPSDHQQLIQESLKALGSSTA